MRKHKIAEIQESQETSALAGKYLTFLLGQEEYGIGIIKIKEIIGMAPIIAHCILTGEHSASLEELH